MKVCDVCKKRIWFPWKVTLRLAENQEYVYYVHRRCMVGLEIVMKRDMHDKTIS